MRPWDRDNSLLETCLKLRMACNGSANPWSVEDIVACRLMLEDRLDDWKPSLLSKGRMFDQAVRLLVIATIEEVRQMEATTA